MKREKKNTYHTIITMPVFQPDTIVAVIILKKFGEAKYPGVSSAQIKYLSQLPEGQTGEKLERQGILCLDMGGSRFDHHRQTRAQERFCTAELVAYDLGVDKEPQLEKILTYAKRDDLEGKGTISKDTIDRAFGLSGLIQNVNRAYIGHPEKVLDTVAPLLLAHLKEEHKRMKDYPEEYRKKWDEGKIEAFVAEQMGRPVRCVLIESDIMGMVGFLRAHSEIHADIVAQKYSTGHTNIITRQDRRLDLREVVAVLRVEEMKAKKQPFDYVDWKGLYNKGKMREVPEWYYDTAANSIQNGGMMASVTPATGLTLQDIKKVLMVGLNFNELDTRCPHDHCLGKKCRFYFYNLIRCRKIRMSGGISREAGQTIATGANGVAWSEKAEEKKPEVKTEAPKVEKATVVKEKLAPKIAKKKTSEKKEIKRKVTRKK